MRKLMLSVLLLLLTAPALSAAEERPAEEPRSEIVPAVVEAEPATKVGMRLSEIQLEERTTPNDAAMSQLGPRGGFWWIVGVIVVAGVILAVLL